MLSPSKSISWHFKFLVFGLWIYGSCLSLSMQVKVIQFQSITIHLQVNIFNIQFHTKCQDSIPIHFVLKNFKFHYKAIRCPLHEKSQILATLTKSWLWSIVDFLVNFDQSQLISPKPNPTYFILISHFNAMINVSMNKKPPFASRFGHDMKHCLETMIISLPYCHTNQRPW